MEISNHYLVVAKLKCLRKLIGRVDKIVKKSVINITKLPVTSKREYEDNLTQR